MDLKEKQDIDSFNIFRKGVLKDFFLICVSREASILGRKEVLSGKAKFGIFSDGKELPQIALSKIVKKGDYRSGYYRDQTLLMALNMYDVYSLFSGLYANTNISKEPNSGGRQMVGHFSNHHLDEKGDWLDLTEQINTVSDISPTAGQMPRILGLALATKYYKTQELPSEFKKFSKEGNEITIATIGNASTSEGYFFETLNSAGVKQLPLIVSVWDDGYGISVDNSIQTIKQNISEILEGFRKGKDTNGLEIIKARGWNYPELLEAYRKAEIYAREKSIPVLVHITELTQPLGHSTSGSHERYKTEKRLEWENKYDCNIQFKKWILSYSNPNFDSKIATIEELDQIEKQAKEFVLTEKKRAWSDYSNEIKNEKSEALKLVEELDEELQQNSIINLIEEEIKELSTKEFIYRRAIFQSIKTTLRKTKDYHFLHSRKNLLDWLKGQQTLNTKRYSDYLYSSSDKSFDKIKPKPPKYADDAKEVDGRTILRDNFDAILEKRKEVLIFGEDVGKIGDVNQGTEGLQEKYGKERVFDTGIREASIIGKGIGLAVRGLRPIAEIQYLDYVLYGLQLLSDDVATMHFRTKGKQKCPLIVRTRGHRLEGIWHSGSPIGGILNLTRGMYLLCPRNMTQAAGMYNSLLQMDNPAILIECLNAYRKKEKYPKNIGKYRIPLGVPDILKEGSDITVVTYGSCCPLVMQAAEWLEKDEISCEVIDVQTLVPFDVNDMILKSIEKTNKIIIVDEDVPGGASAYIFQEIFIKRNGYDNLESKPLILSGADHRPAYSSDGDYFSKPSADDIYDAIYKEFNSMFPKKFLPIY